MSDEQDGLYETLFKEPLWVTKRRESDTQERLRNHLSEKFKGRRLDKELTAEMRVEIQAFFIRECHSDIGCEESMMLAQSICEVREVAITYLKERGQDTNDENLLESIMPNVRYSPGETDASRGEFKVEVRKPYIWTVSDDRIIRELERKDQA